VLNEFKGRGKVMEIQANNTKEEVFRDLEERLKGLYFI
jgi:hypothetical protein